MSNEITLTASALANLLNRTQVRSILEHWLSEYEETLYYSYHESAHPDDRAEVEALAPIADWLKVAISAMNMADMVHENYLRVSRIHHCEAQLKDYRACIKKHESKDGNPEHINYYKKMAAATKQNVERLRGQVRHRWVEEFPAELKELMRRM